MSNDTSSNNIDLDLNVNKLLQKETSRKGFFNKFINLGWIIITAIGTIIFFVIKNYLSTTKDLVKKQNINIKEYKQDIKETRKDLENINKVTGNVLTNIRKNELDSREQINNINKIQDDTINDIEENKKNTENITIENTNKRINNILKKF